MEKEVFYTNFGTMAWVCEPVINTNIYYAYNAKYGLLFEISMNAPGVLEVLVAAKVYSPLIKHITLDVANKYCIPYSKTQVPIITSTDNLLLINGGEYVIDIVLAEINNNENVSSYILLQIRPGELAIIAPNGAIVATCTISSTTLIVTHNGDSYSTTIDNIAKIAINRDMLQINFIDQSRAMLFNWQTGKVTQLVSKGGAIVFAGDYYIFQDEEFDEHLKNISLVHIPEYCYIMEIEY